MATNVNVTKIFDDIMASTMRHVVEQHGEQAMHGLFFELYDHTFAFLEREFGFDAVMTYWNFISDDQLSVLEELMKTKGFRGMEQYWLDTMGQEGATDYQMDVTDDSFSLVVKHCPPMEWFESRGMQHYSRYCEHCKVLYSRVGERCGFQMQYIPPDPQAGTCCGIRFTRGDS